MAARETHECTVTRTTHYNPRTSTDRARAKNPCELPRRTCLSNVDKRSTVDTVCSTHDANTPAAIGASAKANPDARRLARPLFKSTPPDCDDHRQRKDADDSANPS